MRLIPLLTNPALIGILALFLAAIWMVRDPKDKTRPLLVFALVLNLFYGFLLTVFMQREGSLFPWKFDFVLFRMDASLGLHAAAIARPLQGALRVPLYVVYQAMIPMMIGWFLLTRYRIHRRSIIPAYAAELAVGPLLYALLPACGPLYAFGAQWLHPPAATPAIAIRLTGMPNAFPSLHMATALVLVFFAPGRKWRALALAFLVATGLATLSTGEHYLIDLVPGLAFGAFAAGVGLGRYRQAAGYLGIACAWTLTVRFAAPWLLAHPLVLQVSAALTVVLVAAALVQEWRVQPQQQETASALEVQAALP
ncbi:MAG TPA: phosphatase PAP2 family protein [Terracidiphilus sp.]|nr:phosphatase PAP2 family protein [Terracidiphilus sp.]